MIGAAPQKFSVELLEMLQFSTRFLQKWGFRLIPQPVLGSEK